LAGAARLEKQILELEVTYQEQRTRLVGDMRADNERAAAALAADARTLRAANGTPLRACARAPNTSPTPHLISSSSSSAY
jgi:hypothetical protein